MMLVLPDGYILNAKACFFANRENNDAKILNSLLENSDGNNLKSFFKEGDILLLDHGFRDSKEHLDSAGIKHFMPGFIDKNAKQLSCNVANESRMVTMGRFVVETANGRIKNFK